MLDKRNVKKMNPSKKYNRSLHAHISLGSTSDDRFMPQGYVEAFAKMPKLVLSEKLDGQNNCFSKEGLFARSHACASILPWDKPMRERWELIKRDLGDYEIFGENMYGIHSIAYSKLESYFYVFAVRVKDVWLSWEASTQKSGLLGGYNPFTSEPSSEGFVVRNADEFKTNDGILRVAENEFNNLFKVVRQGHVQTDEHWTKNWQPAKLENYYKYGWYGYEHLSRQ